VDSLNPSVLSVNVLVVRPCFGLINQAAGHVLTTGHARREAVTTKPAFEDVELGCLLGQGSYGKVFRGVWEGKEVAVKVMDVLHS